MRHPKFGSTLSLGTALSLPFISVGLKVQVAERGFPSSTEGAPGGCVIQDKYYHVVSQAKSWRDARDHCARTYAEGYKTGSLVALYSAAEAEHFKAQVQATIAGLHSPTDEHFGVWLRGNDIGHHGTWAWVGGDSGDTIFYQGSYPDHPHVPLTNHGYTNWLPGYPDGLGLKDDKEGCVRATFRYELASVDADRNMMWDDHSCSSKVPFVCEYCPDTSGQAPPPPQTTTGLQVLPGSSAPLKPPSCGVRAVFHVVATAESWETAETYCRQTYVENYSRGSLVILRNAAQAAHFVESVRTVLATLYLSGDALDGVWLGGSDIAHHGAWKWVHVDDEEAVFYQGSYPDHPYISLSDHRYTNWLPGYPDGLGLGSDRKGCLRAVFGANESATRNFMWDDYSCSAQSKYVCEYCPASVLTTEGIEVLPTTERSSEPNDCAPGTKAFAMVPTPKTWRAAREYCESTFALGHKPGQLVILPTEEEADYFKEKVMPWIATLFIEGDMHDGTWLGGNDIGHQGTWVWYRGHGNRTFYQGNYSRYPHIPIADHGFSNWLPGYPDALGIGSDLEGCVRAMYRYDYATPASPRNLMWDDNGCGELQRFVCEYCPLSENNESSNDSTSVGQPA